MNSKLDRRQVLTTTARSLAGAALLSTFAGGLAPAFAQESGDSTGTAPDDHVALFMIPDGLKGPDGDEHDAFIPSSIVVGAGVPTTLRIVNYDDMPHSITSDQLGLNIVVNAATKDSSDKVTPVATTATITIPDAGTYRWYCSLTCDDWAMDTGFDGQGKDGYMAGFIVAV